MGQSDCGESLERLSLGGQWQAVKVIWVVVEISSLMGIVVRGDFRKSDNKG